MINWVFKTVVGRWVTGSLIALLLSGAVYKWNSFKNDLIAEGTQVCVQEINKETMLQLEDALAAEKSARAELTARLIAVAAVEAKARAYHLSLETKVIAFQNQIKAQREYDETYREWSDAALPDGVAGRLRSAGAGSDPGAIRNDPD